MYADIGRDSFPEICLVKETSGSVLPKESADRQPKAAQGMEAEVWEDTDCW